MQSCPAANNVPTMCRPATNDVLSRRLCLRRLRAFPTCTTPSANHIIKRFSCLLPPKLARRSQAFLENLFGLFAVNVSAAQAGPTHLGKLLKSMNPPSRAGDVLGADELLWFLRDHFDEVVRRNDDQRSAALLRCLGRALEEFLADNATLFFEQQLPHAAAAALTVESGPSAMNSKTVPLGRRPPRERRATKYDTILDWENDDESLAHFVARLRVAPKRRVAAPVTQQSTQSNPVAETSALPSRPVVRVSKRLRPTQRRPPIRRRGHRSSSSDSSSSSSTSSRSNKHDSPSASDSSGSQILVAYLLNKNRRGVNQRSTRRSRPTTTQQQSPQTCVCVACLEPIISDFPVRCTEADCAAKLHTACHMSTGGRCPACMKTPPHLGVGLLRFLQGHPKCT